MKNRSRNYTPVVKSRNNGNSFDIAAGSTGINTFSGQETTWIEYTLKCQNPKPRFYSAAVFDGTKVHVIGGKDGIKERFSEHLTIDVSMGPSNMKWETVKSTGKGPGPICKHTADFLEDYIYVFGGETRFSQNSFKLFAFSTISFLWTECPLEPNPYEFLFEIPKGIDSHSSTIANEKLFIFGGFMSYNDNRLSNIVNELFEIDLRHRHITKHFFDENEPGPSPRMNHAMCSFKNKIFVFGGWNLTTIFQDFWEFDTETRKWSQVTSQTGVAPSGRIGASLSRWRSYLFLFGGKEGILKEKNDFWVFDLLYSKWECRHFDHTSASRAITPITKKRLKKAVVVKNDDDESPTRKMVRRTFTRSPTFLTAESGKKEQEEEERIFSFEGLVMNTGPSSPALKNQENPLQSPSVTANSFYNHNEGRIDPFKATQNSGGFGMSENMSMSSSGKRQLLGGTATSGFMQNVKKSNKEQLEREFKKKSLYNDMKMLPQELTMVKECDSPTYNSMKKSIFRITSRPVSVMNESRTGFATRVSIKSQNSMFHRSNQTRDTIYHKPGPRFAHSASVAENTLFIFGGLCNNSALEDLHSIDLEAEMN